jgi:hypothetical protein
MDEIQSNIMAILQEHKGFDSRIKRADLCARLGTSDRWMRAEIEDLRMNYPGGAYICSSTDGGYYLALTLGDLDRYLSQDEHRAKKTLARISRQRLRAGMAIINVSLPVQER